MSIVRTYSGPDEAVYNDDFSVRVREQGGNWVHLSVYEVMVDMHHVRKASMVQFDMEGTIEVEITSNHVDVETVTIRPLSKQITFTQEHNVISFSLFQPCKLSIEINGDRFHNLHLFANPLEVNAPLPTYENVLVIDPGIHRPMDIYRLWKEPNQYGKIPDTVYFRPGYHYIEETILTIPSGKTIYLAGGAVVEGSFVCDSVENVTIKGRGIIYLAKFERYSSFRGIRIVFSDNITVDGIVVIDPPHYSIFIGQSTRISINNFKSFSTRGWSDGIDMMSSTDISINDIFMRNSDDCIAIYGSRWDFSGDTRNVRVTNAILWADVAHAIMMGTHGDYENSGDTIENILIENVDILEHHEFQENYWGAIALNAGDKNIIQNVKFNDIRVEDFELGQFVDIRVIYNPDYNPSPGNGIRNITFNNIDYNGKTDKPARINGYDENRFVENIHFHQLRINGDIISSLDNRHFVTNDFVRNITFNKELDAQNDI